MAQERSISLNVIAKMRNFQKQMLIDMPGTTEKGAAIAARAMQRVYIKEETDRLKLFKRNAAKASDIYKSLMQRAIAAFSVAAVVKFTKGIARMMQSLQDARNEINDLGNAIGQRNEQLAAFGLAAKTSGGDLSELESSLKEFPKRLDDFARGTGEAQFAFKRLGFTAKEVKEALNNNVDITGKVIKRLQSMENVTQRAAFASQIFGEKGTRLLQVLGSKDLEEWIRLVEKYGIDVGPEAVRTSARWEAASALLRTKWTQFTEVLIESTNAARLFTAVGGFLVGSLELLSEIVKFNTELLRVFIARLGWLGQIADNISKRDFANVRESMRQMAQEEWPNFMEAAVEAWTSAHEAAQTFRADVIGIAQETGRAGIALEKLEKKKKKGPSFKSAIEEAGRAQENLDRIMLKSTDDRLSETGKIRRAWGDTFRQLDDLQLKNLITHEEAEKARLAVSKRVSREIAAFEKQQRNEKLKDLANNLATAQGMMSQSLRELFDFGMELRTRDAQQQVDHVRKLRDRRLKLEERLEKTEKEHVKNSIRRELETFDTQERLARRRAKSAKQAMKKAAKAQKKVAILTLTLDGIVAGIKAFATLGPIAGGIAAAAIATSTGVAIAKAATTPLPKFFRGGVRRDGPLASAGGPGSSAAILHRNEAVLNAQGVRNIGGEGVVDAINQGFSGVSLGAPPVTLDGADIADRMAVRMRRAGDLRMAVTEATKTGRRLAYRG